MLAADDHVARVERRPLQPARAMQVFDRGLPSPHERIRLAPRPGDLDDLHPRRQPRHALEADDGDVVAAFGKLVDQRTVINVAAGAGIEPAGEQTHPARYHRTPPGRARYERAYFAHARVSSGLCDRARR